MPRYVNDYMREALEVVRRANIAAGRCPDCGGSGIVADMRKVARNIYANRLCRTCRGTGKPKPSGSPQERP